MRPILFHSFSRPVPYLPALALQQKIHELQLQQKRSTGSHEDVLLLLEHRPVYTTGRRQNEDEVMNESSRLHQLGADFVATKRGGQTTYHGPGQVTGYPLLDLGRAGLSIAQYICKMQTALRRHLLDHHRIVAIDSDNTGVFLTPHVKVASIGVQVRHRLTSHGFAYNVSSEPLPWFEKIVACGLADVTAGCISKVVGREITPREDIESLVKTLSNVFDREIIELDMTKEGELEDSIRELENVAKELGAWLSAPATV